MINVTKAWLPRLEDYVEFLEGIWGRANVTNNGPLARQLERDLENWLSVDCMRFVSNGTTALQLAIRALDIDGDVITTPYSYVATCSALLWENCRPVFVDVEDRSFCIDPQKIEAAITPQTQAIMATHVYGYPCDLVAIESIAQCHNLKVIYDSAHAFGVRLHGRSVLSYGDISTLSFHATKLFHTGEGGGMVIASPEIRGRVELLRAFGHIGDEHHCLGINGKNSELHAAMGLCILPHVASIIEKRRLLSLCYDQHLEGLPLRRPLCPVGCDYNYAYYPVIFTSEGAMLLVKLALEREAIHARRYFYPSLNKLPYVQSSPCPVSESVAARVICLPLYPGLVESDIDKICGIIRCALSAVS